MIIVVIAIVCGGAAAIGVFQSMAAQQKKQRAQQKIETKPVLVAKRSIARGSFISESDVAPVEWPLALMPDGTISLSKNAVGRVAVCRIIAGEPIFEEMVSAKGGSNFFASIIEPGMRAYTIQAKGPSSSVAGFVRPHDKVDVLLNLRNIGDDVATGGASTTALLQSVTILAIDQILDAQADRLTQWIKGDKLTSVTLLVTLAQAKLLSLGQSQGELSLALRNGTDNEESISPPATIRQIHGLLLDEGLVVTTERAADGAITPTAKVEEEPPPPPTYIRTLRGSQPGRVQVVSVLPANK